MLDYRNLEERFSDALHLGQRPIAISFRETPPSTVPLFKGSAPAGCAFWRIAAEGRSFYTVPSDHYNCPIGSYTHGIDLPSDRAQELDQTLTLMNDLKYIRRDEVSALHRLPHTPRIVIYAPLADTPVAPDVVLFMGKPGRLMLLGEAAIRAGTATQTPLLGRPTCMALSAALTFGAVASTGCIGNRVYTDLSENELYVAIAGKDIAGVADEVGTICEANSRLSEYHQARRRTLTRE